MRLKRGPLGPLVIAALAGLFILSASTPADADGPKTPPSERAAPVSRAAQRAAQSAPSPSLGYDAIVRYASDVAADLTSTHQMAREIRDDVEETSAQLNEAVRLSARSATAKALSLTGSEREAAEEMRALRADLQQKIAALNAAADEFARAGDANLAAPATPWMSPAQGRITQRFGPTKVVQEPAKTVDGVRYAHYHEGIDIATLYGSPVVAAAPGRVAFVGKMADGAVIVVIAHVGGYVSLYAHLDARYAPPTVAAGDYVSAGQKIGAVGLTGITTGAHLHFGMWHDGALVDPMTLFRP